LAREENEHMTKVRMRKKGIEGGSTRDWGQGCRPGEKERERGGTATIFARMMDFRRPRAD